MEVRSSQLGFPHRISSVANPHANCRAEMSVKTVKRMLVDKITANGSLDIDKIPKGINDVQELNRLMGRYSPHETWTELMSRRAMALAKRHSWEHERWNEHTHRLPPLQVGDHVYIQNLNG